MRNGLLVLLLLVLVAGCSRSSNLRLRGMLPLQEQSEDNYLVSPTASGTTFSQVEQKTQGSNYSLVLNGLSLGVSDITTYETTQSANSGSTLLTESLTLHTRYNEFGLMLGDQYTLAFGVGALVSGKVRVDLDYDSLGGTDEVLYSDAPNGNSAFMTLGYDCDPIEVLLGMRWNNVRARLQTSGSSLASLASAGSASYQTSTFEMQTSQLLFGLGLSF